MCLNLPEAWVLCCLPGNVPALESCKPASQPCWLIMAPLGWANSTVLAGLAFSLLRGGGKVTKGNRHQMQAPDTAEWLSVRSQVLPVPYGEKDEERCGLAWKATETQGKTSTRERGLHHRSLTGLLWKQLRNAPKSVFLLLLCCPNSCSRFREFLNTSLMV